MAAKVLPFLINRSQHQLLVALLMVNSVANEALPLVLNPLVDPVAAVVRGALGPWRLMEAQPLGRACEGCMGHGGCWGHRAQLAAQQPGSVPCRLTGCWPRLSPRARLPPHLPPCTAEARVARSGSPAPSSPSQQHPPSSLHCH